MRTPPRVSKRPNAAGNYEIVWSECIGGVWRSRHKSTRSSTIEGAEDFLSQFLQLRDVRTESTDATLQEIWERYRHKKSIPRGSEKTDAMTIRAPLECFGTWKAGTITPSDVEAYSLRRQNGAYGKSAVKPATVRREIAALQAVLNFGSQKENMVRGKPTFKFEKPRDSDPRSVWLTSEQERQILMALPNTSISVQIFTRLGLTYGARKSAMLDLTFGPQIDFMRGMIDFNVPGRITTRKRRAVVPMTQIIRDLLSKRFEERGRDAHVMDRATPDHFKAFVTDLGFEWVTPHVLKHSAVSLMRENGVELDEISRITETDIRTLEKVYLHHENSRLLSALDRHRI